MQLHANTFYHLYNRGNNIQLIFPQPKNYYYFKTNAEIYLAGYCSILAYCFMPNHLITFIF